MILPTKTIILQWNIYNGIIFSSFHVKTFESILNEHSQQVVWQLDKSRAVIYRCTSNEAKCPLPPEIWIYNFSWRILESLLEAL